MQRLWNVFRFELVRQFRRPGYLFTTFGLPILGLVLFFGYQLIAGPNAQIESAARTATTVVEEFTPDASARFGYVDASGLLADAEPGGRLTAYTDEAAAQTALDAREISGYYLIAADYLATGDVMLVQPEFNLDGLTSSDAIQSLLIAALTRDLPPELAARAANPSRVQVTNLALTETEDADEDTSFIAIYAFALALTTGLFVTNGYLLQGVLEEKETRMVEVLISALRPSELLAGKVISAALLGVIQMAAWVSGILLVIRLSASEGLAQATGLIAQIANISIPTNILPLLLVYFLLAYLLFAALYAIVGALSNSMREGPQYAVLFTIPAVAPIYFITLFASSPNETLPTILSLFPLTAPVAMTMRLVISPVPLGQVLASLLLLLLAASAATWVAARVFRAGALLAGQAVRLRDLPMLIRG